MLCLARTIALLVLVAIGTPSGAQAQGTLPVLHPLFSDHAVLQRDVLLPIWGWAEQGSHVAVSFAGQAVEGVAGPDRRWTATFSPLHVSSDARTLTVTVRGPRGDERTLEVADVLVGDVWLCSGQSNMEFPLEQVVNAPAEIANANEPRIRLATVTRTPAGRPLTIPATPFATWASVTPETARSFSAVGYFFARRVHERTNIPIGMIHSSWGGTPIESWTSAEALSNAPVSSDVARELEEDTAAWEAAHRDGRAVLERWLATHDPGTSGTTAADPRTSDTEWTLVSGPLRRWRDLGVLQRGGIVWFRRTLDVPPAWAGKDLTLSLGTVATRDRTWFNGQVIGDTLMPWEPRTYTVPASLVHAGRNVIAVRVLADGDDGGFSGRAEEMTVATDDDAPLLIAEGWRYRPGPDLAALGRMPLLVGADQWVPASLYNGQIAPLVPYALKGFLWYQGEQNTAAPERYGPLLESLIADWRARFAGARIPFGIVQLANFGARFPEPWDSQWAALRDEQRKTLARVPGTGLAVTIDIGDAADIHPKNKQDVGRRLAGWALATVYGKGGEWSGPLYRAAAIEGDHIRVTFDHVGRGLVAREGTLRGFTVAGADAHFVPADARIDGSTVLVSSPSVPAPAAVRYAWDDDPEVSLFNADGLPASPFRTDDWPRRERPAQ